MHTYTSKGGTVFNFNSDWSGNAKVTAGDGTLEIPVKDLVEFVAELVRGERRTLLDEATDLEILGVSDA